LVNQSLLYHCTSHLEFVISDNLIRIYKLVIQAFFKHIEKKSIKPSLLIVETGQSTSINCNNKEAKWFFQKSKENVFQSLDYEGNMLQLKRVTQNDTGYYYCYTTDVESQVNFISKAYLLIFGEFISKLN